MNFEERLSQTQAKLDELKAKINSSIDSAKEAYQADKKDAMINLAKMNAAIEDFGRDVEAQVYCDVTSMKAEAQADASAIDNAFDEIDAKANAKADEIDAKVEELDAKIAAKAEKIDAALDSADEKIDAKVNEGLDAIEGDYYAAKEDIRLAKERYDSKLNAIRLKVQMHKEEVKADIDAKKTAIDKAAQEDLIVALLDYADDCQMIALSYAMEAELAILDACDEIEDYNAKYGNIEEK